MSDLFGCTDIYTIESEIKDRFWHSRCLNNCIDLAEMIGSLASGANTFLLAKNGTKKTFQIS